MYRRWLVGFKYLCLAGLAAACSTQENAFFNRVSLAPGPNPFHAPDPLWAPQPPRLHPASLALVPGGQKLYAALAGTEDEPGDEVAVIDVQSPGNERVLSYIQVGSNPSRLVLHPAGRFLLVLNRYSNFVSVIDTEHDTLAAEIPVPFYTVDMVFSPDGRRAYLANRWKDSVLQWEIDAGDTFQVTKDSYSGMDEDLPIGIAVGPNPRDLTLSEDGSRLYVASLMDLSLSIIDTSAGQELRRIALSVAPGDIERAGSWLVMAHTGSGTHAKPDEGFDTDGDGAPGDGTANIMFQDLQNELDILDLDAQRVFRYTSDSICCQDFRDIDPAHPERGAALPAPDTWPLSRLAYLPPQDSWIVGGALPERVVYAGTRIYVLYSGSNEIQRFELEPSGALTPVDKAGGLFQTGMNPVDIVVSADSRFAYVAERLGDHISVLDLEAGPGFERRIPLAAGDEPNFPATDAELGEAINFVTAKLTVDGDQTCAHCHREGSNLNRAVSMPLQTDFTWGTRMIMAYRGAYDTRPWFFESAMGETNFFPVINEFNRRENFCCEVLDPLIWSKYPSYDACIANPSLSGCDHLIHCQENPPPECEARGYGSPYLTRNLHFIERSKLLFGRDRTFGDALYEEAFDDNEPRRGLLLDFNGITRALGLFLLQRPRFPPNPNAYIQNPALERGRAIYVSAQAACNTCHPLPLTTVSADFNPAGVPLRFPPLITPRRDPKGKDVDRITAGFLQTFPDAEQDEAGVRFGVPQLRGLWDRASRLYHDGRAPNLRQALATPGHPALLPGEVGFNENNGMPNTHGATSHLSKEELSDLMAFILSL